MKLTKLALLMVAGLGVGCTSVPPTSGVATSVLQNCFDSNYDRQRDLFTLTNTPRNPVSQQCLLTIASRDELASASRLIAGTYRIYLSNGGGGGAGGNLQSIISSGGGGGGGGAGAAETQVTVALTEGVYKLTLGAGGRGGDACMPSTGFGGGPGWLGSPTNMVRVAGGELIAGVPGADTYVRPTRRQNERDAAAAIKAGELPGSGGSGPGQTTGGHGSSPATAVKAEVIAQPGAGVFVSKGVSAGGATGPVLANDKNPGGGGGGGATQMGQGGGGGGESPGQRQNPPERGSLGSGGGGGEGSMRECDPGAQGGHGYIALRRF
ncbi:MAG: hypothetical protein ABI409_17565 [Ramlibacter sp.]